MHKFILNLFGFLKSSTQFLKIIVIFLIAMLILYWMQDLTNKSWAWFGFISPLFDTLLDIGKDVSSKSINLLWQIRIESKDSPECIREPWMWFLKAAIRNMFPEDVLRILKGG